MRERDAREASAWLASGRRHSSESAKTVAAPCRQTAEPRKRNAIYHIARIRTILRVVHMYIYVHTHINLYIYIHRNFLLYPALLLRTTLYDARLCYPMSPCYSMPYSFTMLYQTIPCQINPPKPIFCRVFVESILGFVIRTYNKVGFSRFRYYPAKAPTLKTRTHPPNLECIGLLQQRLPEWVP